MSLATIIELLAVVTMLAVGAAAVYVVFEMREVYSDQRDKFLRAIMAAEDFARIQPQFLSTMKLMQSDAHALQAAVAKLEQTLAELKTTLTSAAASAAEREPAVAADSADLPTRRPENAEYVRLGKDILEHDAHLRFALLKDWVSLNALAIYHRAMRPWKAPVNLLSGVPDYLRVEAQLIEGGVLLVGTRGHTEALAVPIKKFDANSQIKEWFDSSESLQSSDPLRDVPAVVLRSGDSLELLQKGRIHVIPEAQLTAGNGKM
jgi:hypothetical protein